MSFRQRLTNSIIGRRCIAPGLLLCQMTMTSLPAYARVQIAPCKNSYSPDQQIQLGQQAAQQVSGQMPVLPDTNAITKYVQQLGQKLAARAPGQQWPYNFHVANVSEINAFALPGGTIFVNLGTIQAAANEAELAGVMAHEISHVVLQHSVCNASKQQKVGLIAGIGQIAAGIFLGGAAGQLAQQGIGMTAGLGFLKMSRGAEKEADLLGAGILYDAGYDPRAMSDFFETLQARYGEGSSQFLSDHPNPGNRSEYIGKEIATYPSRQNYVTTSPAFTKIKKSVAGMRAYTAEEVSSGKWKRQTANQTVSRGVNQQPGQPNPDLNVAGNFGTFQGQGFSISVPANWQALGSRVSAMIAPSGGIARSADGRAGTVVYGLLTDLYRPEQRVSLDGALDALIGNISNDNPGLAPGAIKNFAAQGVTGRSVECDNPSANNGRGEHDWIVAFPQNNGALRYFVFVAPSSDFNKLRPVFMQIAQSITVQ